MKKKWSRILAIVLALAGLSILGYIGLPIVTFQVANNTNFQEEYLSPIPQEDYSLAEDLDYTKASNWFAKEPEVKNFAEESVKFYNLSIPKLKIDNATVSIGGEDLEDSLIQYPGTALPGKIGNAVVFGHSILPQFYDPKNYLAIFSTLPTMRKGDEVKIRYDGVSYRYVVEDIFEVLPTDIEILEQNKSGSFITLVTCTPPGHPLRPKRLIVRAKLQPYNS